MASARDELFRMSATQMASLLARGDVSSVDLARAHLDRILAIDGSVRAFTAVLREQALSDAAALDHERRAGRVRGPLHGLPVSIKENIEIAGHASTLGTSQRIEKRAASDAAIVTVLREAGAVILGRTNVPQVLLSAECRNPVFGQTANPWKLTHSPGGSSGGEGAALASGMSALGIGTDIGGSIRLPCHFDGVTGLKPTLDRWPMRGVISAIPGQEAVRSQVGPMARTVADIELLLRALDPRRMNALDPRVAPVPWTDPTSHSIRGMRIGVFTTDGLTQPSSAIVRAVERAAKALTDEGGDLVPYTPPRMPETFYDWLSIASSDGAATLMAAIGSDPLDVTLQSTAKLARLPSAIRATLVRAARIARSPRVANTVAALGRKPVEAYWALTARIRETRTMVLDSMRDERIDAILCPPFTTPAMPHETFTDFAIAASYTMFWNVLQFPAGVVPVTRVRPNETNRSRGRDRIDRRAAAIDLASADLPVGVQVVTRPWDDERAVAVMATIERRVCEDEGYPRTPVDP